MLTGFNISAVAKLQVLLIGVRQCDVTPTDAGGTVSCCNVGWHDRFIPCFNANLAHCQFGDSAICAAVVIQQQNLSVQSKTDLCISCSSLAV